MSARPQGAPRRPTTGGSFERPAFATDPRFSSRQNRLNNRRALVALLEPVFLERPVKEWMARLEKHDVLCAPVNRYAALPTDPQVVASGMLVPEDHPRAARLTTLDTPIRFSKTPEGSAPMLRRSVSTPTRCCEAGVMPEAIARNFQDARPAAEAFRSTEEGRCGMRADNEDGLHARPIGRQLDSRRD